MLVLTRKRHETVIVGDEIRVTVEEISDTDGRHLSGTRVRLGFQCPRQLAIERSECRARGGSTFGSGADAKSAQARPGKVSEVPDAQVQLRVQVPRRVPVCLNGTPTVGLESPREPSGSDQRGMMLYRITCRREDMVSICKNITVAALAFYRFEPYPDVVAGS
ncbi:MAG: carbon storage regulator [Candidatus Anammoximicrobium sp.]|nr:carbon storage regulator [Candidatus Anammoximicrobium sp.]